MISILDSYALPVRAQQTLPERKGLPDTNLVRMRKLLAERLAKLRALPPGWDSYLARPVSDTNLESAELLLTALIQAETPLPSIVPTKSGGVQIEWHDEGIDFEVRTISSLRFSAYYFEEATGGEWETEIGSDWSRVKSVVDELTRRRAVRIGG